MSSVGPVDVDRWGVVSAPGSPAADHPELECEQLVERQPSQGHVALLERARVVGRLDGLGDTHEPLLASEIGGQVLGIGVAGPVERLAHRRPQARRRQAGRQPVDRHDPAGVQHLAVAIAVDRLELRVVDRQRAAEPLEPAGHDDLLAGAEPSLDEAPAEPRRFDLAGVVARAGRWSAGHVAATMPRPGHRRRGPVPRRRSPPPPRRGRPGATARAGRRSAWAGGTAGRGRHTSRAARRRVGAGWPRLSPDLASGVAQELDGVGRWRWRRWRAGSAGRRRHPTRPRSGTGSTAGRHGGPRRRPRAATSRSGAPSLRLRPDRRHRRRTG